MASAASVAAASAISDYACTLILAKEEARIHRRQTQTHSSSPGLRPKIGWLLTMLLVAAGSLKVSPFVLIYGNRFPSRTVPHTYNLILLISPFFRVLQLFTKFLTSFSSAAMGARYHFLLLVFRPSVTHPGDALASSPSSRPSSFSPRGRTNHTYRVYRFQARNVPQRRAHLRVDIK